MKFRGVRRNKYAVSNQIVTVASMSIFILVVLAVTFNTIQEPVFIDQEQKSQKDHTALAVANMLTGQSGSIEGGDSEWEYVVTTVLPSSVGLRMSPDDVPQEIQNLETLDPNDINLNSPPEVFLLAPANDPDNSLSTNTPTLTWRCDDDPGDVVSFTVYLDDQFFLDARNPPVDPVSSGQTELFFQTDPLNLNTQYWWYVVATDLKGKTDISDIWTFITPETPQTDNLPVISFSEPGPHNLNRNQPKFFTLTVTDDGEEKDPVIVYIDWGDGNVYFSDSATLEAGHAVLTIDHSWCDADTYNVEAIAIDKIGQPSLPASVDVIVTNNEPFLAEYYGPDSLDPCIPFEFAFDFDDIDGDAISHKIEWGDGDDTGWSAFVELDAWCLHTHSWSSEGLYQIKISSRDDYDLFTIHEDFRFIIIDEGAPEFPKFPDPTCCLPAGTMISMADGSIKPIETIQNGDKILTYDNENEKYVSGSVSSPIQRTRSGVYDINDGLISPTDDHPVYVRKADGYVGWAAIDPEKAKDSYLYRSSVQLEVGDELFTQDGWVKIKSIYFRPGIIEVYSFIVEKYHQYFANKILTSNFATHCWETDDDEGNTDPDPDTEHCCFPPGTMISMADGSIKPIEKIVKYDQVLSFDLERQKYSTGTVEFTTGSVRNGYYSINDGLVNPTNDHPLYIEKQGGHVGWGAIDPEASMIPYGYHGEIKQIELGDKLLTLDGWKVIESIKYIKDRLQTYTFGVEEYDQYFADGVLVSNADTACVPPEWCCFPAGTMISLSDGTYKPIEQIKRGDYLMTYDFSKKEYTVDMVAATTVVTRQGVYNINNGLIRPTNDHPLYIRKNTGEVCWGSLDPKATAVAYKSIKNVNEIEIGDELFTVDGWVKIESIEYEPKTQITYTLQMRNHHHYIANNILVKNAGMGGNNLGCMQINCFITGSKIVMADGSTKNIEEMQVGDMIKTYDQQNEKWTTDEIVTVFHLAPEENITMFGNYYLIINGKLGVTPDHPLFIDGQWVLTGDLKVGDKLSSGDIITSIERIDGSVERYTLETKTYHNYVVLYGDEDEYVIAHNQNEYNIGGYEESQVNQQTTTSTNSDSIPILSYHKVMGLEKLTYEDLKDILGVEEYLEFTLSLNSIQGSSHYFYITPSNDRTSEGSSYTSIKEVNVLICDPIPHSIPGSDELEYTTDFAVLEVQVF